MTETNKPGGEEPVPEHRDSIDERVVGAGWGTTLRMVTLRVGSAYADRISQADDFAASQPALRTRSAIPWTLGAAAAATATAAAAYARAHGVLSVHHLPVQLTQARRR